MEITAQVPWRQTHAEPFPPVTVNDPPDYNFAEAYYRAIVRRLYAGGEDFNPHKKRVRRKKVADDPAE